MDMQAAVKIAVALAVLLCAGAAWGGEITATDAPMVQWHPVSGEVEVIDGDTIRIAGERIRLSGIDASEIAQPCRIDGVEKRCGIDAKVEMMRLAEQRLVTCHSLGRDRYGRVVATCDTAETPDLGEAMVRAGYAIRWPEYDPDCRYCDADAEARREHRGMWAGEFEMPWIWRHREKEDGR